MSHIFRSVLSTQLLHFFIFRNNCTFPVQHSQSVSISIDNCIFYTSLSFQVTQKELKPCINARFQPFYDLITFYTIFISKLFESALFTHLFCQLLFTVFSNAHFIRLSTLSSILLFHFTQFPFG